MCYADFRQSIADRNARGDGQPSHDIAGEFDHPAVISNVELTGAEHVRQSEAQISWMNAFLEISRQLNSHGWRHLYRQGAGGEHKRNIGQDPKCQRPDGSEGAAMRIVCKDEGTRANKSLLHWEDVAVSALPDVEEA